MQQQQNDTKSNATETTKTATATVTATTTAKTTTTVKTKIASTAAAVAALSASALPNAIVQDESPQHWPALHEAAAAGNEALLANLLSGGILRTAKEPKNGNTALHEAAWRGFSRCVKLLCTPPVQTTTVESGANKKFSCVLRKRKKQPQDSQRAATIHSILIGLQNHGGFTALHLAAQQGHNQSCRELLLAGADPDIQNKYGDTALHTACRYGHAGATRILLSGSCDANRVNLNGDTPLHISCAMRRRKLTRILLTEGDCNMSLKNAQNETPVDIVIRKSFVEIFDILNNQQRLRQQCKQRHKTENKKTTPGQDATDAINWSPYGCHYFPDPRAFPAPKLETLPKEPLAQGEQYYSDLNGCIRKGPIGVGSTCYCAPFFRHIEHKINCNRRSLRRYVHNAKATLGHEVKALAERTNQQIEQLTRDMLCDRVRCESRRRHIDYWLQMAAATQQQQQHNRTDSKEFKPNITNDIELDGESQIRRYSLSRCQSLDALSENKPIFPQLTNLRANNAQSCNLLDDLPSSSNVRQRFTATPTDSLDKQSNLGQVSDDALTHTSQNLTRNDSDKSERPNGSLSLACEQATPAVFNNPHEEEEVATMKTRPPTEEVHKHKEQREEGQILSNRIMNRQTNREQRIPHNTKYEAEDGRCDVRIYNNDAAGAAIGRDMWQQSNKLTVKAVIEQRSRVPADEEENEKTVSDEEDGEIAASPAFVVPKEKMDISPSYAQLKKTLPAKLNPDINNSMDELTGTLDEVNLTPTPILHAISLEAENMEVLSDTITDDSEEDEVDDDGNDIVDDPQQQQKRSRAIDYLYEFRKRMQNTTTPTSILNSTNKFLQQQHQHQQYDIKKDGFLNNNGLLSNYNFNRNNEPNYQERRVVPKNAYFHALPNKMQHSNNQQTHNHVAHYQQQQPHNHNQLVNATMLEKRPQNVLNYTNLPNSPSPSLRQDPRLAQRLLYPINNNMANGQLLPVAIHHTSIHTNGNYLSPVNSNSGSSIASSTPDYERAMLHPMISRQQIHNYMPRPQMETNPGRFVDGNTRNLSAINHNHNNISNNYLLHTLEPASSQLIYSANTVALALADQTSETADNEANSAYPLVSSLV